MTEQRIVMTALALIGLYVADDNFVHPERGVPASAHLASGGALLGTLALFALAYRRLRPGWKASFMLPVGLLAIVAGASDSVYHASAEGVSGDDLTGFMALLAGVTLLAMSAAVAWRSRRVGDAPLRRYVRRAARTAVAAFAGYIVLFPWALSYLFTHAARGSVPAPRLGARYESIAFRTSDGLSLKGWYVPSKNGAAVISAPGRGGSQRPARMLIRHGFGVLLFDRRGEGESDGEPNEFGWSSNVDLKAAIAYLQTRSDVHRGRIGGIGLSVGGETLLQTAAETAALKAVVADGAGARSVREEVARPGGKKWGDVPTSAVITAGTMLFANREPPPNLTGLVGRIAPRPLLFIYGELDQDNVRDLEPAYFRAAGEPKAIWFVRGAAHTGAVDLRPREYERRIVVFFDRALGVPERKERTWR